MSGFGGASKLFGAWLVIFAATGGRALQAQRVVPPDTVARTPSPGQQPAAGYGDSAARVGTDTGARSGAAPAQNSAANRPDTTRAPADTAPPPADPALVAACKPGPDGAPIGVLLLVKFDVHATDAERTAAATKIGGRLGGDSPDGLTYVVPPADKVLRDVEDSLIRARGVREVGEQPCP